MNNREKNAYRKTKAFQEFRERLIKDRGLNCELLGTKLTRKTAVPHHLRPGDYKNLDLKLFKLVSPMGHLIIEFLAPLIYGNKTTIPRRDKLMEWIGDFLPEPERTVDKYYEELREMKGGGDG